MNDVDKYRIQELEKLLIRAYPFVRDMTGHGDGAKNLMLAMEQAVPHPSPFVHAHCGRGETRCGIDLFVLPKPKLASKDEQITCVACVEAFIAEKQKYADELLTTVAKGKEMLKTLQKSAHKIEGENLG